MYLVAFGVIDLCRLLSILIIETIKGKLFENYLATVCKNTFYFSRNIGIMYMQQPLSLSQSYRPRPERANICKQYTGWLHRIQIPVSIFLFRMHLSLDLAPFSRISGLSSQPIIDKKAVSYTARPHHDWLEDTRDCGAMLNKCSLR